MRAFQEMCALFESNQLGLPPIPARFRPRLDRIGDWAYATRDISPIDMYLFGYPQEAKQGWVPDYVAVSHAVHGVNSYAITYQLVSGPLALFAQVGYGGLYGDNARDAQQVRRMFEPFRTRASRVIGVTVGGCRTSAISSTES
jgi:hypothetical protein